MRGPKPRHDLMGFTGNPARPDEVAIATFERSVFVSPDRGKTWKEIAVRGQAK